MASISKKIPVYTVDAFSDHPFAGNQAAVCPLEEDLPDDMQQKIGSEMNLAETAFIKTIDAGDSFASASTFGLRWFTPGCEVKMCGHATLASAKIIYDVLGNTSEEITFKTLSGDLKASKKGDKIELNFPIGVTETKNKETYSELLEVMKLPEVQDIEYCPFLKYLLIRLKDGWTRDQFEAWQPDIGKMIESEKTGEVFLVIVTVRGTEEGGYGSYDFVSRIFAPWAAIDEDSVTGSAHTVLPYYWRKELGKDEFFARQCSKRGGEVTIRIGGDRAYLQGDATIVMEGFLII